MKRMHIDKAMLLRNAPPPSATFMEDTEKMIDALIEGDAKPMKRRISTAVLVAALVMILAMATALAISLSRSEEADIMAQARRALHNDYGLTGEALGCFNSEAIQSEEGWTVSFEADATLLDQFGAYTVTIAKGHAPKTQWTHDDTDPALWQGEDLYAPAWGQQQILKYLAMSDDETRALLAEIMDYDAIDGDQIRFVSMQGAMGEHLMFCIVPPELHDVDAEDALAIGREIIAKTYGYDAKTLSACEESTYLVVPEDGDRRQYIIRLRFPDTTRAYALVAADSGEVLSCFLDQVPDGRSLPEGTLSEYMAATAEFFNAGSLMALRGQQQADAVYRLKSEGFAEYVYSVDANDLPDVMPSEKEHMVALVQQALTRAYDIDPSAFALFDVSVAAISQGEQSGYSITLLPRMPKTTWETDWDYTIAPHMGTYTALLWHTPEPAMDMFWSYAFYVEEQQTDATTWGGAEVYPGKILTHVAALLTKIETIAARYPQDVGHYDYAMEDAALYDTAFRDAGFSALEYSRMLPPAEALSYEEAIMIAKQAMLEELTDGAQAMQEADIRGEYALDASGREVWRFSTHMMKDGVDIGIGAVLDGRSSEILMVNVITGGAG